MLVGAGWVPARVLINHPGPGASFLSNALQTGQVFEDIFRVDPKKLP
jgi:hypothetical protein